MQSQCFDCAKTYGEWTGGGVYDLNKTNNAIYVTATPGIHKYDLNCNLIWKKDFGSAAFANCLTIDEQGNLYTLVTETLGGNYNNGIEPYYVNGLELYFGLNLYKLSSNGNIIWNRKIGVTKGISNKIFFNQGHIYITGTFINNIKINNQISLNDPAYYGRAFIAKFDISGNLINAKKYGTGNDLVKTTEIDKNGNIYFARTDPNITYSFIDKINSDLEIVWQKEISNNGKIANTTSYRPTILHYNPINNKLYLWGCFDRTINILGNQFTTNSLSNGIFQSILTEFNTSNGNLEHFKQVNNNSLLAYPSEWNSSERQLNKSFMAEKNNELFILSSFNGTMTFPNTTITSRSNSEELVLFKMDLNTFEPEFILKSSGTNYYTNGESLDAAGPILFNGNDLFLTSNFQSYPLKINNSTIQSRSGNNSINGLLYKLKLDSSINSGEIIVENTCFNTPTMFEVKGTFDSILWNFNDPNSTINNTSTITNPQHQFSSVGTYHVTATVNCGSESQTLEKDIKINSQPTLHTVAPIYSCESISGSGISNSFDTSNINSTIMGNQTDLTIEYIDSYGNLLPSPLPNPYTNTVKNEENIRIKSYFTNNPYCFVETNLKLYTLPKPTQPTTTSPQTFCIQQNATLSLIFITGQNIKWYDALTNGNLLANTSLLQNGITYYASQTINGCESARIPVLINIQNTPAPTGDTDQSFCSTQNATLNDIEIIGTNVKWYNNSNVELPKTTLISNNGTYYATQTINTCESTNKLAVNTTLINTLNANNFAVEFCDDSNDGKETINLSVFNPNLISNPTDNSFSYYTSLAAAENQIANNRINNISNYLLPTGSYTVFVRIDSPDGCHQVVELGLNLYSKPIIPIDTIMPICEGSSIDINAGNGYDNYLWSTGETSSTITIQNPGNYSVTVTNDYDSISCSSTKDFTVKKSTAATITTIETQDWTDNQNTIKVFVTGEGDFEYSIDGIHFQDSNEFSNIISGQYTVQVRDKNGCGTVTNEVYLLMYPKFFTPNGDGFNDTWKIKFSDSEKNITIKIFDRYGKLLKVLLPDASWNGQFNNQELPATDYWFIATRVDGKEYKGHFSLKR